MVCNESVAREAAPPPLEWTIIWCVMRVWHVRLPTSSGVDHYMVCNESVACEAAPPPLEWTIIWCVMRVWHVRLSHLLWSGPLYDV